MKACVLLIAISLMGMLNLAIPLVLLDKSRLIPVSGFSFILTHPTFAIKTLHYNTNTGTFSYYRFENITPCNVTRRGPGFDPRRIDHCQPSNVRNLSSH